MGHPKKLPIRPNAPKHSCMTAIRTDFYETVAAIIRVNPSKTYEQLQAKYGFSPWTIKMAVKRHDIKRTRGRKVGGSHG